MRLYRFINERETFRYEVVNPHPVSVQNVVDIINKNCSKYLKETKGKWFKRSMDIRSMKKGQVGYRKVRQDRKPQGMEKSTADDLNKWLIKNGHADRSKSVICSRDSNPLFGDGFWIFIEGNYKYTWADTPDLNMDNEAAFWYGTIVEDFVELVLKNDEDYTAWGPSHLRLIRNKELRELRNTGALWVSDEVDERHRKRVKEWLEKSFPLMFHTDRQMNMAYANNAETWFQCKSYYFFDTDDYSLYEELNRKLIK